MSVVEVVAKPVFGKSDADWLVQLRGQHAHSPGPPEFTLAFPNAECTPQDIARHVTDVCAAISRIHFCLRSAMIVPELDMSWFHVFLVPEEGFGAIIRLHDRLHVGPLTGSLRPGVPYIPHLTVASLKDFAEARRAKATLNGYNLKIAGHIETVDVRERDGASSHLVATATLARHGLFR